LSSVIPVSGGFPLKKGIDPECSGHEKIVVDPVKSLKKKKRNDILAESKLGKKVF